MNAILGLAGLLAGLLAGCSAPALGGDLTRAEAAASAGQYDPALAHYRAAIAGCGREPRPRLDRERCASAHLGRAELLARIDRRSAAAQAYEAAADALADDRRAAAEGVYRAGRLRLELGQDRRAYALLWRTITNYPEQGFAADALKAVVRDGRRRNPGELYRVLVSLIAPLTGTGVGDNILYALADLAEHENRDPLTALGFYDKIIAEYPGSGLRDDAYWHAARVARQLGEARGAAERLRAFLATREVAIGAGSYNSIWFDDAQLELGRILRDELGDSAQAVAAFARVAEDYPASVLRDDALWEIALTWETAGDGQRTCAALARLAREWPDSKYQLERAPALARKHGCRGQTPGDSRRGR